MVLGKLPSIDAPVRPERAGGKTSTEGGRVGNKWSVTEFLLNTALLEEYIQQAADREDAIVQLRLDLQAQKDRCVCGINVSYYLLYSIAMCVCVYVCVCIIYVYIYRMKSLSAKSMERFKTFEDEIETYKSREQVYQLLTCFTDMLY